MKKLNYYRGRLDDVPGIFSLMKPLPEAINSFKNLSEKFETYLLSTAPWDNPNAGSNKLLWVKKYIEKLAYKRLILTHNKQLNNGNYLVDDRTKNGAGEFSGELLLFGSEEFPDWTSVREYLMDRA